jgi:hypothetical protein
MATGIQDAIVRWPNEVSSPFTKLTRRVYPRTIRECFAWAEELWMHHGMYSQSISTAVRYFMTELDIEGDDLHFSDRKKYLDAIGKNFDVLEELAIIGDEYMSFGNAFTSMHRPFQRQLVCRGCGFRAPLKKMVGHFKYQNQVFQGTCPLCHWIGQFQRVDVPVPKEVMKPKITRWPPQFMMIKQHPLSGRTHYSIDLNKYSMLRDGVTQGDLLYLEDTPWEIMQAINDNMQFEFAPDELYHMSFPVVSCCLPNLKGWGLPPFMADFETALLVTLLDKYTETILVEYLMPFRVLSPPQVTGPGDPMMNLNMNQFVGQVMGMIRRHRANPTDWNFLPSPVDYNVLGGEAQQLVPVEVLEHFELRLLHSMGIPPEFYKASLDKFNTKAGPVIGFKMFERTWQTFANQLNKWATWLVNKQGDLLNWQDVDAKLKEVSMYEDPEIRQIKLELSAAGKISDDTAFRPIGLDAEQERRKLDNEEEQKMEESAERDRRMNDQMANMEATTTPGPGEQMLMQQEMAAQQQGGEASTPGGAPVGAPPGGAPMGGAMPVGGGGGGMGPSIDDLMLEADQIAQQLITADPLTRRRQLVSIKNQNEALHAQVKSRLSQLEQEAKTQGLQLARQGQVPAA